MVAAPRDRRGVGRRPWRRDRSDRKPFAVRGAAVAQGRMSEPWTWHGGGLSAAQRRFGAGGEPWIDLSTGINPNPWPQADRVEIDRSEEHTSELQSLMRSSYAVFCLKKKHTKHKTHHTVTTRQ